MNGISVAICEDNFSSLSYIEQNGHFYKYLTF